MKRILTLTLGLFMLLSVAGSANAQQTRRLTAEKHNEYGLIYTLPTTNLAVRVKARKSVYTPGPFAQFARQCLGLTEVTVAESTTLDILDVDLKPYGVPNRDEQYLMQLKPGVQTFITVADNGMLLAVNAHIEAPETPDVSAIVLSTEGSPDYNPQEYLQYVGEEFLASQSTLRQAQMLAQSLLEVRERRIELTRGTADEMPADGRQLELMLQAMTHQEEVMMRAFTGNSYSVTSEATYTFTPGEDGRSVLLRINDFEGFTTPDDYSGEPLYINVKKLSTPEIPKDEKGEEKKLPKDAVIYTIPGTAEISLSWRGRKLLSRKFEVAQYGVQFGLNPLLFTDKKSPSYLIINPATGGVETLGSTAQ